MNDFLQSFANAIATMEGYFVSGSVADRNNNPGNLRGGPNQSAVANGYGVYSDVSAGWSDLMAQINKNINRGLTLYEFFAGQRDANGQVIPGGYPGYAPSADSNNPLNYANFVGGKLGIPINQPIAAYLSAGAAPANSDIVPDAGPDSADTNQSGFVDWPLLAMTAAGATLVWLLFFRG